MKSFMSRWCLFVLLSLCPLAIGPLAGCSPSPTAPAAGPTQSAGGKIEAAEADAFEPVESPQPTALIPDAAVSFEPPPDDDLDGGQLVEESWDAYSMQGSPVGYARTTIAHVEEEGRKLVRTSSFSRTVLKRAGQSVTQDLVLTSYDTPDGKLVQFATSMSAGPAAIASTGKVEGDKLQMEIGTLGTTQTQSIPWDAEWGGIFAPDQSLRRQPMKPSEERSVRGLLPVFNVPGETRMVAGDYETVDLPNGATKLLKVNATIDLGGQTIETTMWIDERGQTLKSHIAGIGQEAVRTTKELALNPAAGAGDFDLLVASTVKLKGELPNPTQTRRVVYRARMKNGAIAGLFAEGLSQRVRPIDERTAELTVLAVRPDEPAKLDVPQEEPTEEDLAANTLIQSDDPEITKLALAVAPSETDPWKLACALEKHVDRAIRKKNFSQAFATAAEVARSLEGDCTEHAVLLAALCRARGIPARVAFGLVYYPPQDGFAYHMWNEVWIADRWVPLDGTLGLGGIGGDHIKLADSSLAGASAYSAMLPVIQVFGRLELEVLKAE